MVGIDALMGATFDSGSVLGALPDPVLAIGGDLRIRYMNPAAEQFFRVGAGLLQNATITEIVPADHPLLGLIRQVQATQAAVHEHGARFDTHRTGPHEVSLQITPLPESPGAVVLSMQPTAIASKLDLQLSSRGVARSVTGMAAVLAHEVKNPLSGIRGAAQLLEQGASGADRELTQLICDETDRICALVDRMEMFADRRPLEREAINIHQIIEHVRRVAQAGFGSRVAFRESYDPSLPPVSGNRDQLVQAFLNLVKNAVEATEPRGGEVVLSTAYRHGLRLTRPGSEARLHLPLEVAVQDNGSGVPEDVRAHLFDPFITTKRGGTGLGLPLVAKIVEDHGGVVEWESEARRTVFRVRFPVAPEARQGKT
ncbi:MAG: PAS domain-containing protein [Alphaproteobacteria bacterium]|nr:PAS domain-containing protein [Alphaproteobacteria bacterium]